MGTKYTVDNAGIVTLTNDLIVDTNVLKVDTTGNFVGINKTTPVVALDVVGGISATGTIAGTFSGSGAGLTSIPQSAVTNLVSDLAAKATDSLVVHLAGIETITGAKTFNAAGNSLIVSNNTFLSTLSIGASSVATSTLLDVVSTTLGTRPAPSMTTAQKLAIATPATGLLVYDSTLTQYSYYNGTTWGSIGGGTTAAYQRTAGTGNGSQTVFTVPAYVIANNSLLVYNDGVLMTVTTDYTETSSTSITFNTAPANGAVLSFVIASIAPTYTYNRTAATGNGSTTVFSTPTYTIGNSSLLVYNGGVLMSVTLDYTETSTSSITFVTAPDNGANISFVVANVTSVSGTVSNGLLSTGAFVDAFTNGIVVDYTAGMGRISVGAAAGITLYNAGVANTPLMTVGSSGAVSLGTISPNAASLLQMDSTTRGFLPPRMTTAQRNAISTPPAGLVIYNTDTSALEVFS